MLKQKSNFLNSWISELLTFKKFGEHTNRNIVNITNPNNRLTPNTL